MLSAILSKHTRTQLGARLWALLLALALLVSVVRAQTTAFTFQGRLTDGGTAANGTYDMQFELFDAASAGEQIGATITNSAVSVSNGVFTVSLDFGANAFPGADRFLEISVRHNSGEAYTTLLPRQQLASGPYAIRALAASTATNATQLGGVAANQYVVTSDARLTDARAPAAGSDSYVQNTTTQQANTNFNVSGNGTVGGTLSATAVNGFSISSTGSGVYGQNTAPNGTGILGQADTGTSAYGVWGKSAQGRGVVGDTSSGYGIWGRAAQGNGVVGESSGSTGYGILGTVNAGAASAGVYGQSTASNGNGVIGQADTGTGAYGVWGKAAHGRGVFGQSTDGNGVYGYTSGTFAFAGVYGFSDGPTGHGVIGEATGGSGAAGVFGKSSTGFGVHGESTTHGGSGVFGQSTNSGAGVEGKSSDGIGVLASGVNGIRAVASNPNGFAGVFEGKVIISSYSTGGNEPLCRSANIISLCSSSLRYKTDVQPFLGGLEIIKRLRPISFTWKTDGTRDLGLGAEEVQQVAPLLTSRNDQGEIEGVKYNQLSAVFINAFKEQQREIDKQQKEIEQLRKQLRQLQQAVSRSHRRRGRR